MEQPSGKNNTSLYNSRIIDTYIKLIKRKYSFVDINDVLTSAKMKPYQVADQGHWFTQKQVDRFYEKVLKETGNQNIAREAGQYAASPDAIGVMRQYILGLIGPARVYEIIGKATSNFVRSSTYTSKRISANKIEITVTPVEGVKEKSYQCENRMGFWEAISIVFNTNPPKIEHPECMFKGGKRCRYIISWDPPLSFLWKKIRNILVVLMLAVLCGFSLYDPAFAIKTLVPLFITSFLILLLVSENAEKRELKDRIFHLKDTSDKLVEQIETNYNNSRITNDIGQAIANLTDTEDVLSHIVRIFKKRLDYDRGLVLLANKERTLLEFRVGFGYDTSKLEFISNSAFHLDNPKSKGVFIVSFKERKPFLINDIRDIGPNLSKRSLAFAQQMGTQSFICCPIICDGQSIGVLAVDNLKSKRPLLQSDLSLLNGIASVISISIRNAELNQDKDRQFRSILQVLADSIDARDPLTAGHSEKVTEYALGICNELNLSTNYREMIRVAALLHDYGKIGVPDSILKKPGRLTKEEYEIVKTHAVKTEKILKKINFTGIFSQVPEIAGAHHEKIDGSGYPNGLKGDSIPLGAKIIAVADFFEAITAKRHYRDPLPVNYAFRMLHKERGVHFEKKIVDAFIRYYDCNYAGKGGQKPVEKPLSGLQKVS